MKNLSVETKRKISKSKRGISVPRRKDYSDFYERYWTEERREQYKKYGGRNSRSVTDGVNFYSSVRECARQKNISVVTCYNHLRQGILEYTDFINKRNK